MYEVQPVASRPQWVKAEVIFVSQEGVYTSPVPREMYVMSSLEHDGSYIKGEGGWHFEPYPYGGGRFIITRTIETNRVVHYNSNQVAQIQYPVVPDDLIKEVEEKWCLDDQLAVPSD